ncbi:MAG: AAA family ATPase [Acidimicrobiales bacterium]
MGKSTLLQNLARTRGVAVLDLDDVATREAVAADPATFVAGPSPVCIDEYQHVPLVLDAIKAELNRDGRPGRFILTGSARHEALPTAAQALTGRLHRLPVYPLSHP